MTKTNKLEDQPTISQTQRLLLTAQIERKFIEDELLRGVAQLVRAGERIKDAVREDTGLNELGELQGIGPSIDRLCAQRQTIIKWQERLRWLVAREES